MNFRKKRFKFKAPSVIVILVLMLFIVWIITLPMYLPQSGSVLEKVDQNFVKKHLENVPVIRLGIFDVLLAPFKGFIERADFLVFILILGIFMHLLVKSQAVEAGFGRVFAKFKNKEIWMIPITMIIISFLGSIYGFSEETLVLYPILIPMFLKSGFDTLTVLVVIVLGSIVGVAGSTVNPFSIGVANNVINSILGVGSLSLSDGIVWRIGIWIVLTFVGIAIAMIYARRVQKNNKRSYMFAKLKEHQETFKIANINFNSLPALTWRRKLTLVILITTFLLMILGSLPYDQWGFNGFTTFHKKYMQYGITKLWSPFGQWYFIEYAAIFLISTLLIGLVILKEKEQVFTKSLYDGACEMVPFIIILSLASGIKYLLDESNFAQWFGLFLQNQGISKIPIYQYIFIILLIYTILSFLIISTSAMALVTLPFIVPIASSIAPDNIKGLLIATVIIYVTVMAAVSCITPTNIIFMFPLEKYQIPLNGYYKVMWLPAVIIYVIGAGTAMLVAYLL